MSSFYWAKKSWFLPPPSPEDGNSADVAQKGEALNPSNYANMLIKIICQQKIHNLINKCLQSNPEYN
jgi:hypothetical protein